MTLILLAGMCSASCDSGPSPEQLAKDQLMKTQHQNEIIEWRKDRIAKLTTPDGWLSLVGMHWLPEKGTTRVGSGEANGTRIAAGPSKLGLIQVASDTEVWFDPESGVPVTIDGILNSGRTKLASDSISSPTVVGFDNGQASFIVIERGGKLALRVRNSQAPALLNFDGLDYFDIDRSFRVQAKFIPHEAGRTYDVVNILGMIEPMINPGVLQFTLDEKTYSLEALDEGDHRLFIVFADLTSGHDSYPAGRFLYAEYPDATGMTEIDFNKAYNPPCAFNAYSTCPMPPDSNRLELAVNAGEKKPKKIGQ
ncbi:MAG TPA: DUF1684 domain-containing protein [Arenimonas sp.]|nr:DUF1684 domain-containing protein [Arenimonas sp.]